MNCKAKGSRNERRARCLLEAAGWCVVRAGGSLGAFDLVAFGRHDLRLIQAKTNRGLRRTERERLRSFSNLPAGARKEIWLFRDRQREPHTMEVK